MIFVAFRRIAGAPPRLAPYLAAALACNLTLGALIENFGDMLWTVSLGIAIILVGCRGAQPVPLDAALGGGAGAVLAAPRPREVTSDTARRQRER